MSVDLDNDSRTAWISQGFERLVDRVRQAPNVVHFDVLIIGSGYGGAIAAATFAGRKHGSTSTPVTVGVLERGKEYLPGAFPTGLAEIPRHVRHDRNKEGLFDIRVGGDVTTVVANGVGGGSLINAGVMAEPSPAVFQTGWPSAFKTAATWPLTFYTRASDLLGGTNAGVPNTIEDHPDGLPLKYQSIKALVPSSQFRSARITVAMHDVKSSGGVNLKKCNRCGDCATGCNFGAKNSLDVNLLVTAQQNGAEIFSGATVLSVERDGSGWKVNVVYTDGTLRARHGGVVTIRAHQVVLAAGTLGSTEIMLRSKAAGLSVSDKVGQRCSTNGDMLITDYDTTATVHTVADETVKPSLRAVGPTITGMIDLRSSAGVVIEEMSVPAGLRIAFTEIFGTVNTLHSLAEEDSSEHNQGFADDDIYAVPKARIENSALYAVMGNDGAIGAIELDGGPTPTVAEDGVARMKWDKLNQLPLFDSQVAALQGITGGTGGRKIPNPVWKLLPPKLAWLLKEQRGPLTTVHPLGGCVMADTGGDGGVDHLGRVFSTSTAATTHDGLVVLDGSIIPTALGTNPSLTIAAVALRAAEDLAGLWGYVAPTAPATGPFDRPVFRYTDVAAPAPSTEIEIIERLVGPVRFKPQGKPAATWIVEVTLRFAPKALAQLSRPPSDGGDRVVQVATDQSELAVRSRLRILPLAEWRQLETTWDPPRLKEQKLEAVAEFSAPLTGSLRIFQREKSTARARRKRAFNAYLSNRGWRDAWQWLFGGEGDDGGPGTGARIKDGKALATRSGEIRTLVYDLTIGTPDPGAKIGLSGTKVAGTKTFTYERRANPWRQLMDVALDTFPGLSGGDERVLKLDARYLARIGVPLFRIVRQRDGASAIGELVSFLGYALRLVLGLHIWSFRAPDKDVDLDNDSVDFKPPSVLELPGGGTVNAEPRPPIPIGPDPPDLSDDKTPVAGNVLVTRYPHPGTTKRPVVMLHGYSAGGTTFAHDAVKPNFASYFWKTGRDVWVADLRTSPEEPTATKAWSFDEIGVNDVTAVVKAAAATSVDGKVDVIAHCMGTIVFSNAVLRGLVKGFVDRAAFTQVGPLVVFSPANVFRAYVLKYLIEYLPDSYEFAPPAPTLADDLWDRILSTLPYPVEEFDVENPIAPWKRTPWTRTRHRMDALYGRDFNAEFMEGEMLRFIDEHFGRMSLKTVAQTLHFVRFSLMTDFHGRNQLVSRAKLKCHWEFPVYSLHGENNGLAHVSTVDRMRQALTDAGRVYLVPFINPGAGHQDALVGTKRFAMMQQIEQFLDATIVSTPTEGDQELTAYPPWIGPIISEERPRTSALVMRVGASPALRAAEAVLIIRVLLVGSQILRPDDPTKAWDQTYIEGHMVVYSSKALRDEGWDAFEAPLPQLMPGYDPAHPGNALLVLLVYAEDRTTNNGAAKTTASGHFVSAGGIVSWLNPKGPAGIPPPHTGTIEHTRIVQITKAASRVLITPPIGARMTQDPGARPPKLAYFGPKRVPAAVLELAPQPVVKQGFTTLLSFGPDPNAPAALELLLDHDRDLLDGVVPYDPPASPPTQPTPGTSATSFALAACQYPAGLIDEPVAYRSYGALVERLEGSTGIKPRFLVFAGDQVYVDPTAGLYDPAADDDRFRLPYENWLRAQSVRDALRRIPSFMLLDDHEIGDNWEPVSVPDDGANDDLKTRGGEAYKKYESGIAPPLETFVFDGFHFFMLDTRTERSHRKADASLAAATLIDSRPGKTLDRLKTWLANAPGPKFVVSPAMLLPRHRRAVQRDRNLDPSNLSALHSDGWDGYPGTLREVLAFIAANSIPNVVFLSGDEHRGCVARIALLDSSNVLRARVHSIHTPALYAPYPFANTFDEDIVANETIQIAHSSGNFNCVVNATRPPPGDGATYLAVRSVGLDWCLDVEFPDGAVQTLTL